MYGTSDTVNIIPFILLLVLLFGLTFGQKRLKRFLNQHLFQRHAYSEGERLVTEHLEFTARASLEQIRSAVLSTVQVASSVPTIIMDAYVAETVDNHIVFGYGNKLNRTNFMAALQLRVVDGGVQGSWDILNWTKVNGIVDGISTMKRLIADINTALAKVDPAACLRPSGTPVEQPRPAQTSDRSTQKLQPEAND